MATAQEKATPINIASSSAAPSSNSTWSDPTEDPTQNRASIDSFPPKTSATTKEIHQEKKLELLVDKDLKSNYDRIELEEMVQVALLCTQYLPGHRPKMSEVVRMLEGDELAERWGASQRADTAKCKPHESSLSDRYSDLTDDSLLLV